MNIDVLLNSLVRELWSDLQRPDVVWQLSCIALCLLLAWPLERWAVARWQRLSRKAPGEPGSDAAGASAEPSGGAASVSTTGSPAAPSGSGGHLANAAQAAHAALARVIYPAAAAALVALARPVLAAAGHHTQLLHAALVLLGALAVVRGIVHIISKLSRTASIAAFERLLVALVWAGVALYLLGLIDDVVALAESVVLPVGKQRVSLWTIMSAGFWVMATMLFALWLGGAIESRLLAVDAGDKSVRVVLARALRAVLLLVALLVGLSLVGLDLTALSVFGGALGVGIGLGLQRIASSYISGFVVLLERRVRLGDLITVDKYFGQVTEIRTRFTIVRSPEGFESIVPNEMLMANTVQNHSKQPSARMRSRVSVAYGTDLDALLPQLEAIASEHARVTADPAPVAMLTGFGADGLDLELAFNVDAPVSERRVVQSDVNRAVLSALRRNGIDIPYPQREIRVLNSPPAGYTSPQS